ncbi:hypothetical protein ON010_g15395 [Phytophthora cinnamomi]|nr:hypothetical protein ON010_g15395 [Phytophthora cinnamomi]
MGTTGGIVIWFAFGPAVAMFRSHKLVDTTSNKERTQICPLRGNSGVDTSWSTPTAIRTVLKMVNTAKPRRVQGGDGIASCAMMMSADNATVALMTRITDGAMAGISNSMRGGGLPEQHGKGSATTVFTENVAHARGRADGSEDGFRSSTSAIASVDSLDAYAGV